jgi:predicted metal-dependent RNase
MRRTCCERHITLPENLAQQITKDAPKRGEVYSDAPIIDWLEESKKQLAKASIVPKFAGINEMRLDRATETVTVTILFK